MITLTIAAGSAIKKFSLNLSVILQPCPLQAAMVVSEIKDRLSPNIAPLMTEAMQSGTEKPDAFATAMPMGTISVIVPTEVPMASDTRQLTMKSTATANCGGIRENEVGNAVCGGSADNADKNPCQHEDENHRDNIRVADAGAHNGKLIIELQGAVLQTGNKQGNQKYDNNRDFVKAHFDAQAIFKQYAKT